MNNLEKSINKTKIIDQNTVVISTTQSDKNVKVFVWIVWLIMVLSLLYVSLNIAVMFQSLGISPLKKDSLTSPIGFGRRTMNIVPIPQATTVGAAQGHPRRLPGRYVIESHHLEHACRCHDASRPLLTGSDHCCGCFLSNHSPASRKLGEPVLELATDAGCSHYAHLRFTAHFC